MNGDDYFSGGPGDDEDVQPYEPGSLSQVQAPPMAPPQTITPPPPAPIPSYQMVAGQRMTGNRDLDMYTIAEQHARRRESDEEFSRMLLENTRVEDAAKAVEFALKFQALRTFGRDVEAALAAGVPPEIATARAAARNPAALGGGSEAAAFISSIVPPRLESFKLPSGEEIPAFVSRGRAVPVPSTARPRSVTPTEWTSSQGRRYVVSAGGAVIPYVDQRTKAKQDIIVSQIKANNTEIAKNLAEPSPSLQRQVTVLRAENAKLMKDLEALGMEGPLVKTATNRVPAAPAAPGAPQRATPAAPPTASPQEVTRPPASTVFPSSAAARAAGYGKGDRVRIKGVGLVQLK